MLRRGVGFRELRGGGSVNLIQPVRPCMVRSGLTILGMQFSLEGTATISAMIIDRRDNYTKLHGCFLPIFSLQLVPNGSEVSVLSLFVLDN